MGDAGAAQLPSEDGTANKEQGQDLEHCKPDSLSEAARAGSGALGTGSTGGWHKQQDRQSAGRMACLP